MEKPNCSNRRQYQYVSAVSKNVYIWIIVPMWAFLHLISPSVFVGFMFFLFFDSFPAQISVQSLHFPEPECFQFLQLHSGYPSYQIGLQNLHSNNFFFLFLYCKSEKPLNFTVKLQDSTSISLAIQIVQWV